jgi:hypothetical protein
MGTGMKPQISEKGLLSLSVFVFQCKFIMFKNGYLYNISNLDYSTLSTKISTVTFLDCIIIFKLNNIYKIQESIERNILFLFSDLTQG